MQETWQEIRVPSLDGEGPLEEGMANPLQFSCLETPMDRGSWKATVPRVAKSWTQLKRLSSSTISKVRQEPMFCPQMNDWKTVCIYTFYILFYIVFVLLHILLYKYNGILFSLEMEILPFSAMWMKLEDIILSAISQTIKDKTCVLIRVRMGVFPAISVNKDVRVISDFSPPMWASEP